MGPCARSLRTTTPPTQAPTTPTASTPPSITAASAASGTAASATNEKSSSYNSETTYTPVPPLRFLRHFERSTDCLPSPQQHPKATLRDRQSAYSPASASTGTNNYTSRSITANSMSGHPPTATSPRGGEGGDKGMGDSIRGHQRYSHHPPPQYRPRQPYGVQSRDQELDGSAVLERFQQRRRESANGTSTSMHHSHSNESNNINNDISIAVTRNTSPAPHAIDRRHSTSSSTYSNSQLHYNNSHNFDNPQYSEDPPQRLYPTVLSHGWERRMDQQVQQHHPQHHSLYGNDSRPFLRGPKKLLGSDREYATRDAAGKGIPPTRVPIRDHHHRQSNNNNNNSIQCRPKYETAVSDLTQPPSLYSEDPRRNSMGSRSHNSNDNNNHTGTRRSYSDTQRYHHHNNNNNSRRTIGHGYTTSEDDDTLSHLTSDLDRITSLYSNDDRDSLARHHQQEHYNANTSSYDRSVGDNNVRDSRRYAPSDDTNQQHEGSTSGNIRSPRKPPSIPSPLLTSHHGEHGPSGKNSNNNDDNDDSEAPEIEVSAGVFLKLRGALETRHAIERDFIVPCECFCCSQTFVCIQDASLVLCPDCRIVNPVVREGNSNTNNNSNGDGSGGDTTATTHGVALGCKLEELANIQQDILSDRQRR